MLMRRSLAARVAALSALPSVGFAQASGSFEAFLAGIRREAQGSGVSTATLNRAFAGIRPNERVLELDRRQAEFTISWEAYRDGRLSAARIDAGRRAYAENRGLLAQVLSTTGKRTCSAPLCKRTNMAVSTS
jgi:membrane-bound lytic murein transglycosylase B